MENVEKYYRRSYNALNNLIKAYKDGYNESTTFNFRNQLKSSMDINPTVMKEERTCIMFTAIIALLGLNKESMEHTGKFLEYKKNNNSLNIRNMDISNEAKAKINLFDSSRAISTDFDEWLSIFTKIDSDITNLDHLRRVRNGLLHSNFYLDQDYPDLSIAHIKIKNYYEAEVLNDEFQMFVFEYFSNLGELGLTENINAFNMPIVKINSREDLLQVLFSLSISTYDYDGLTTLEKDTPELLLKESTSEEGIVDITSFNKRLNETHNYQNMSLKSAKLSHEEIVNTLVYLEKTYGDNFYKLDPKTQSNIITGYLQFIINPKREVSNWLLHFWYLYATIYNGKFNKNFFSGDEFGNASCYSSLLILKAYLIMYRLQHNDFLEIDYGKINFDVADLYVDLKSSNLNNLTESVNYFKESFIKEKAKGILNDDNEIWNKIVCDVLRNSLAHGNIKPFFDVYTSEMNIEISDIDTKKGKARTIVMPISKFEELLNSEAFFPKYCLKKDSGLKKELKLV